jgi:hypothetical protein
MLKVLLFIFIWLTIENILWIEKVTEVAANTKDAVVAGEKVVEEKLAAAKETVLGKLQTNDFALFLFLSLEKSSEVVDSAKQAAHDVSVKAHEIKESAGEKLESAEKAGRNIFFGFFDEFFWI